MIGSMCKIDGNAIEATQFSESNYYYCMTAAERLTAPEHSEHSYVIWEQ